MKSSEIGEGARLVSAVVAPAHIAGFPTQEVPLRIGDLSVRLLVVAGLRDFVDVAALLRDADAPEPPYWAHLWTGSRALARLVATEVDCSGQRVIDLGCGVGLVGVVAAMRGARAVLIDNSHAAAQFAGANARLNRCEALAVHADIRHAPLRGWFARCFAADVTYDPALQRAVAAFLATHLAPGGTAWCAESVRTFDLGFREACAAHGLQVSERTLREREDGRDVAVRLTTVCWPAAT